MKAAGGMAEHDNHFMTNSLDSPGSFIDKK
jgi:hypothetical protein